MSRKLSKAIGILSLPVLGLALMSCSSDSDTNGDGSDNGDAKPITISFAHSYEESHPHHVCGAQVIADRIADQPELNMTIEIFSNSQLGGDAERINSIISGDIDMDLQGSSAISAVYPPIGVLDAAYAFESADHMFDYFGSDASAGIRDGLLDETGVRSLGAFYFGDRTFSANSPIRSPEDLKGLKIRYPQSPAYLLNAEAVGAEAVDVAFEEVYLALQQGIADGQENPVPTVKSMSLDEVQSHISMNRHQVGFQVVVFNDKTWNKLNSDQQSALQKIVDEVSVENRACIEQAEQDILDEWKSSGKMTVVEDVDRQAFIDKAEAFFLNHFTGEDLEVYKSIRESAN